MTAYETLLKARKTDRATSASYIANMFEDFLEFSGDRLFSDDKAIVGGIAMLRDMPVTVIGIEKGKSTEEKVLRNFGSAHPEGYRKSLRLMRQAEKFGRPVFLMVDTAGAYCGIDAEERGQGAAIADNLKAMMGLKTPVISVVIGEGGSGGALALAVADEVWMLENAVYSVLSPEGAASIIWKDASRTKEASESLKLTAKDLLGLGVIERIVPEPENFDSIYESLKKDVYEKLKSLCTLKTNELLDARYNRFRKLGGQNL